MTSHQIASKVARFALEKQAEDVLVLDLRELTTIADYFVIVTGTVDVHLRAIIDHVERELRRLEEPIKPLHVEGYTHLNWVLVDLGEVVLHAFQPEARRYYQLEQLWGDAPTERLENVADIRS
ncbi:MAG: Ribosomal silencing factor RsfS [Calditrichaeota bacterium]|nr:Ribosomal silencing factor RsfS [Calditrichota bacterium]